MATYYLNSDSSAEDGLTPETGYHTLVGLLDNVPEITDGDTVKIASPTITEPDEGIIVVPESIEICPWEELLIRPEWSFNGYVLFYGAGTFPVYIHDISIKRTDTTPGTFSMIAVQEGISLTVSRNRLSQVSVQAQTLYPGQSANVIVINNIFSDLPRDIDINNIGSIEIHPADGAYNSKIINNTFYDGAQGVSLFDLGITGKVLNNIFMHNGNVCIYRDLADTSTDLVIDNNVTFDWGGEQDFLGVDIFIGSNNLRDVDPVLEDAVSGNFTPTSASPCLLAGTGYNANPDVPIIDFLSAERSLDTPTIGALEDASTPPDPEPAAIPVAVIIDGFSIPLFENGIFSETVSLDGNNYGLSIAWNARAGAWFMSIADGNGNMLWTGIRLNIAFPMKLQFNDPGLPSGDFILIDKNTATAMQEAGRDDFVSGRKLKLLYISRA